jgi:hypothetical protein
LLVSPSVVAHLLRVEGEIDEAWDIRNTRMARSLPMTLRDSLPETLRNTLLVVALQEFNLDTLVRTLLWDSFRNAGMALGRLGWRSHAVLMVLALLVGGLIHLQGFSIRPYLAFLSAVGMLYLAILGFTRKREPLQTWNRVGLSTLLVGVATWLTSESAGTYVGIFLSGIVAAWWLGWLIIPRVDRALASSASPFQFRALDERQPGLALLLFLAFLGLVGFPITPAFLGQDLVLFHISGEHAWMAPLIAISLVLNGISASGVYMRLCAGRPVEIHS